MFLTPIPSGLHFTMSSIPRGLLTVYQISSSHVSPLERQHECPFPIVFWIQCLHGEGFEPHFPHSPSLPSPLQSSLQTVTALQSTPAEGWPWAGEAEMGTLVTRGGGHGGRAELAQILANFFITVPKARILTPLPGSLGWKLGEAFPRQEAFLKCCILSAKMYAYLHSSP